MTKYAAIVAGAFAIGVSYGLYAIWARWVHSANAKKLGCQPPFARKSRLPLGIDIVQGELDATSRHVLQNDHVELYDELGRATWSQSVLGTNFIITVDPENIKAILATQFKNFELGHARRGSYVPFIGHGIFTEDAETGKTPQHAQVLLAGRKLTDPRVNRHTSRTLLRPQFTRGQISDLELEENHVQNLFTVLPAQSDSWTSEVDLAPLFFHLTMDTSTEFLFGESVGAQLGDNAAFSKPSDRSGQKVDWSRFVEAFDRANLTATMRNRFMDMYWVYRPSTWSGDCKVVRDFADHYVQRALDRNISGEKEAQHSERYVFLDELVKETRDPVMLRGQLLNIMVAGRDTTAGLLGWTWYWLARHPAVFTKLRETVLAAFGTDTSAMSFESLKECQYLQHVLSEVLRLHPLVPENIRQAVNNTSLPRGGGPDGQSPIYIEAGQSVLYNVHVMQRRKDLWGQDADDFRPERWVDLRPGWNFLPFNGGPRICLGQQFALTEASYVMVRMLQRFDKIRNLDQDPIVRHRYTSTTSPHKLLVQLHVAS